MEGRLGIQANEQLTKLVEVRRNEGYRMRHWHMRGESLAHLEQSERILRLAEQQEQDVPRLVVLRLAGVSYLAVGKLDAARRDLDRSLSLYRPAEHRRVVQQFGLE